MPASRSERVCVGRDAELSTLIEAVLAAVDGRGGATLIAGDAGVGKSTLVEELASRCGELDSEIDCVWAQCWEGGGAPAFWPWFQLLRRLDDDPPPAVESGSEQARFLWFDAVAQRLARAAQDRPRLLVIEDLHAADVSSLSLLRFAADAVRRTRVLLIGTYRPHELEGREDAAALVADIVGGTHLVELGGLEREDVAALLRHRVSEPAPDRLVDVVHGASGGNALFADELVRLLVRTGRLAAVAAGEQPPVPPSVRAAIAARLGRARSEIVDALRILAVAGREVDRSLATHLLADRERWHEELEEAVAEQLLTETAGGWRFSHVLIQAVLYESLPPARRAALHLFVAETIEHSARGNPAAGDVAHLAHHFGRAAGKPALRRAAEYSLAAGREAMRLLAYEEAAGRLHEALERAAAAGLSAEGRWEILMALGDAEMRAANVHRGRDAYRQAWELAEQQRQPRLMALAALGFSRPPVEGGVVNDAVLDLTQRSLDALGPEAPDLAARLRSRLAGEMMFAPTHERREQLARQAMAALEGMDDIRTRIGVLRWAQSALMRPENTIECLQHISTVADLAAQVHDVDNRATALAIRTNYLVELGRPAELAADVAELHRISEAVPAPLYRWYAQGNAARVALMRGAFAEAEELLAEALEQAGDVPNALAGWFNQHLYMRWEHGTMAELEGLARQITDTRPGLHATLACAMACFSAEAGRQEEARQRLRTIVEGLPQHPRGTSWLLAMNFAAEAARMIGDSASAEPLHRALLPFADRHAHAPVVTCVTYWGSVQRHLGNLAGVLGRWEEAAERAEAALAAHLWMGADTFATHSRHELGLALLNVGRDRERARELLAEAHREATRLHLARLATAIDGIAGHRAPAQPGRAGRPDRPVCEARLEGEYWSIASGDVVTRLRDSKGVRHLLRLLEAPGRPLHVLELVAASGVDLTATRTTAREDELSVGTTEDPVLDAAATRAYRARIAELQEELEEATRFNDGERAARSREELQLIEDELRRSIGLGGRSRALGRSAAEQARVNVTKAIRTTVRRIESSDPDLGRHLRLTVKTGMHCCYMSRDDTLREWRIIRGPEHDVPS